MNTLQISGQSLRVSKDEIVILSIPKNALSIDVLSLDKGIIVIYNKYLANFTKVFTQPLDLCQDADENVFTKESFIAFAEANFGF